MQTFRQFVEQRGQLYNQLLALRPKMAQAAQAVYDNWEQGGGGICDEISQEIQGVIAGSIINAEVTDAGQEGDDHAWTIVYNDTEAYEIDIPCSIYERGGGYSWTKVQDVRFDPDDVIIHPIDRADIEYTI